ncbi:nucleotidyltransferase [Synergistales bacterium]|nr:nucleotidyltransferase [Synergistales bacterium]
MGNPYHISEIREKLLPIFHAAPIYRAVLFGSYANGEATAESDVDIVIDSRGELLNISFFGVLEDIVTALGKKVDLIEISEIREGSPILNEISSQGIVLYER